MGKMAFKMLEKNTSVFFEEDLKEFGLKLTEVTVFSGLCTELPNAASNGKRAFCFIHFTFQVKLFSSLSFFTFICRRREVATYTSLMWKLHTSSVMEANKTTTLLGSEISESFCRLRSKHTPLNHVVKRGFI